MAKSFKQTVIGLEIEEERILLSQLDLNENRPIVTKIKEVSIPPRSIIDGLVTDPESIADHIQSAIDEGSFSSNNIVISLNDHRFLKRSLLLPNVSHHDIMPRIQDQIKSNILYAQKEFQVGYQIYAHPNELDSPPSSEKGTKVTQSKHSILYAALPSALIDNLEEIVSTLDKTLVSVDLVPLAVIRAMLKDQEKTDRSTLYIYIDSHYIDINIVYQGHVLLSHIFRHNMEEILEDEFMVESCITIIKQLCMQYSNLYPHLDLPQHCFYSSRLGRVESFLDNIQSALGLSASEYSMVQNIDFISIDQSKDKLKQYQRNYLPSIGLALKFFEPINQSLSITKVKKELAPIFDKYLLTIHGIIFAVLLFILFGGHFYYSNHSQTMKSDLDLIKNKIRSIQSGAISGREKKVKKLQESIQHFGGITTKSESKYIFFHDLVSILPSDLSLSDISIKGDTGTHQIALSGQAYYQDSIYTFYEALQQRYTEIELTNISTQYNQDDIGINTFKITFSWSPQ